ncbi:BTB/POZ domain-containing protein Rnb [Dermacentor variabilis]|uniref:BTB/POZ domain-containing protein Rnb n=1 Tax=Dermacentor variabilis TaxID=34621 RepID=UPI003F5BB3E3
MSLNSILSDLIAKITSGSFSTSFNALIEVSKYCRKDSTAVSEFCALGGISALLGLVEKPKYSDICLSILANCCLIDKAREEVIRRGGCRSIARILSCIEKESVRNRACRGLANIAMTSRGAKEIHGCKAVEHVVTFLTSPTSCESQATALRAVRILANTPESRDDLIIHKAPAAVVTFLQTEALQKPAVQALASLTQSCSLECALQIKEAGGFKVLEEVLQASDSGVLESAFAALVNLSVVGDVRPDLGAAQAISALIRQLSDYKLAKPSYGTLFSSLCRYSQESVNRVRIRESGGLPLLVQALSDQSRKELWSCCVCAILHFRYDEPSLAVLWSLDLVPTLLVHIRDYTKNHKKDQHCADSTGETLSGLEDLRSLVMSGEADGIDDGSLEMSTGAEGSIVKDKESMSDSAKNNTHSSRQIVPQISVSDIGDECVDQKNKDECEVSETKSEVTDYDDVTEQVLNEEVSSELSRHSNKNTFCIHSPSYREIESQNSGPDAGGYCPDLGYHSNPVSPDQARRPVSPLPGTWSPRSTDSGLWSPCSTPRCDSPVSVSSPEPFRSFSPVCSESDSDSEQPIPSCIKNMVESVCRDIPKKREFIKRKRSSLCEDQAVKASSQTRGTEDDSPPRHAKRRRRRTLSESVTPTYKDPQEMLLDGMLRILTVFTVLEMPEYKLGATDLFDGLMHYLYDVPSPLQRASQIMTKITSDLHSFEDIVCRGEVLKLIKSIVACGLKGCKHCQQFRDLGKHWLSNLTHMAESGYGSGVLAHCLLTQGKEIQTCCCLTIPYIVRNKSILRQLLFDCSALDALLDLLEEDKGAMDKTFCQAVDSLAALCASISEKRSLLTTSLRGASGANDACRLEAFTMDVQLQVDDGSRVTGNRLRLSEANDYFKTMLNGHFVEKDQEVVAFRSASGKPLNIVIHFLHGCNFQTCAFMSSELSVNVQLDVLGLCDLMLLPNLQRETEIRVRQNLKLESVCDVYSRALELGMAGFRKAALWFVLMEKTDSERRCKCLCELVSGKHGGQVLDDIASLVRENLDMNDNTSAI